LEYLQEKKKTRSEGNQRRSDRKIEKYLKMSQLLKNLSERFSVDIGEPKGWESRRKRARISLKGRGERERTAKGRSFTRGGGESLMILGGGGRGVKKSLQALWFLAPE